MANAEKRLQIIKKFASDGKYDRMQSSEVASFVGALCKYVAEDIPNADGKYTKTTTHIERYTSTTGDLGIKGMSKNTEVKTRETKETVTVDDTRQFSRGDFERAVGNVLANLAQFRSALPREQADSLMSDFDQSVASVLSNRKDLFPGDPVGSLHEFLHNLQQKALAESRPASMKLTVADATGPGPVLPLIELKTSSLKQIWALFEPLVSAHAAKSQSGADQSPEDKEAEKARMAANQEKWKKEREEEKERKAKAKEEQKQREEANRAKKAAKKAEEDAERRAQEAAEAEELRLWREKEAKEEAEKAVKDKEAREAAEKEEAENARKEKEAREAAEKERIAKEEAEAKKKEADRKKKENPFYRCPAELQGLEKNCDVTRPLSPAPQFSQDWDALRVIQNHISWTTLQADIGVQSFSIDSVRDGGSLWTSSTPISVEVWLSSEQLATAKKAPFILDGMTGVNSHSFSIPAGLAAATSHKNLRAEQIIFKVLAKGKKLLCEFNIPLNTVACLAAAKKVHGGDEGNKPLTWTFLLHSHPTETSAKKAGEWKVKEKTGRPGAVASVRLSVAIGAIDISSVKTALSQ